MVQSYGDGRFRVSGTVYPGSVIVLPERTESWNVDDISKLTLDSLAPILEADQAIDVLFVGCGAKFVDEPAGLRVALKEHGIILEWMDTGAACRTLNVLVMDGRSAAAALIAVP